MITRGTVAGTDYVAVANSTASSSTVLNRPTSAASGDILVAELTNATAGATITAAPTGWTPIPGPTWPILAGTRPLFGYYKVIQNAAAEPASYTWTWGGTAGKNGGTITRYSGVDLTSPSDVDAVAGASVVATTLTLPSIDTVTDGAFLLSVAAADADTASTLTRPPEMSLISQHAGLRAGDADEHRPTAGPTGTRTWTQSGTGLAFNGFLWALRPAGSGPNAPYLLEDVAGSLLMEDDSGLLLDSLAPYLRSFGAAQMDASTSTTVATVTIPADAVVGDKAYLFTAFNQANPTIPTTPAGWQQIDETIQSSTFTGRIYEKIVAPGDPGSTVTITYTTVASRKWACVVATPLTGAAVIGSFATTLSSTSFPSPTVDETVDALTLAVHFEKSSNPSTVMFAPDGMALIGAEFQIGGGAIVGGVAYKDPATGTLGGGNWESNIGTSVALQYTLALPLA